ncbi:MAG: hypothetical protein QM817_30985 [Archangium sp.]
MQRWAALTLIILSGCDSLTGRPAIVRALERSCDEGKKGKTGLESKLDCGCLIPAITGDFTEGELRALASDANFFTGEEMQVLIRRRGASCLKPLSVAQCEGKKACVCVIEGLYDGFEGDALWDVVERYQQGRPLPVEFSSIVTRCQSQR